MGTREVYEEKLRSANLQYDPTIKPGLGSPRCPRCLSLIQSDSRKREGEITPVLHNTTMVAGVGIGALLSSVHGFNNNYWFPFIQKHVKGPKWVQIAVGAPPLLLFSGASAVFGGYALPKFAQLTMSSYYAAYGASHYAISQVTRRIEGATSQKSS